VTEASDRYHDYVNPLVERYASTDMRWLFSPQYKFQTWRRLWVALAEAEAEAGLDITVAQIEELRAHVEDINFAVAEAQEKQLRHDVMAHIYAYGEQCPTARGIIHLGATSAFVGDNTDLIQMREGLRVVRTRLVNTMQELAQFAAQHRALVALGYTHFLPAQLTTVGRRAVLWLQDLVFDLEDLEHCLATLHFRGAKGATGTQASFLQLCNGDEDKVKYIDRRVAEKMGFERTLPVTGQTYPRKYDSRCWGSWRVWRNRRTSSATTFVCCRVSARWKNRLAAARWGRRPWPISATPYAVSVSRPWRGTSSVPV